MSKKAMIFWCIAWTLIALGGLLHVLSNDLCGTVWSGFLLLALSRLVTSGPRTNVYLLPTKKDDKE